MSLMAPKPKVRTNFLFHVVLSFLICATLYHHYLRPSAAVIFSSTIFSSSAASYVVRENHTDAAVVPLHGSTPLLIPSPGSSLPPLLTSTVLLPEWEVLVIASPETTPSNLDGYSCLFETSETSPARFSGLLRFPDRATFSCLMPDRARRKREQSVLLKSPDRESPTPPTLPLLRWSYLVYDSLATDDDVVLFVKGVNNRQGINRLPTEFRCVFAEDGDNGVRTAVTTSMQEVFRCKRPELSSAVGEVKVSLEIVAENRAVPSVAYYAPARSLASKRGKSLLCATTMVYNVTKFLREWITYHSKIGVEKFLLYDNGSEDDLQRVVDDLVEEGFDVNTYSWRWPKTQEAGFSHSVLYAKKACTWMMYLDVDEFVYSPSWQKLSKPSNSLLQLALNSSKFRQFSIGCHEFGPSDQKVHPPTGVIQGYNCRRKYENRHKSIVLLDAVDDSLLNVIHHFQLKSGYRTRKVNTESMVINHYKYQAWPEFKAKFRRRVSAYVLDWTQKLNPNSKDRTPGLGFAPVEPQRWPQKFCEVRDNKLKDLASRWFEVEWGSGD